MWPCGGTTGRSRGQKTSWLRTDPLLRGGAPVRLRLTLRRPCADGSDARHTTCDVSSRRALHNAPDLRRSHTLSSCRDG